jgi:hypothetical protein
MDDEVILVESETPISTPICECGVPSVKKTTTQGPNRGRPFYTCGEKLCKFFTFADLSILNE